jgi:uncharacterized protein HemY
VVVSTPLRIPPFHCASQACEVYVEALEFSAASPQLLTTLGLLYLREGENKKALLYLGRSLTYDPVDPRTILAAGSIIQVCVVCVVCGGGGGV